MDHYKTLGLSRTATKEEIKEAFRRCALKFHPDRHSQSSKEVRDGASLRFKLASEAYEVLIDDRKRADYDFVRRSNSSGFASPSPGGYGYSYRQPPPPPPSGRYGYGYSKPPPSQGFDAGLVFRYMTTRGFLLHVALASVLFGGAIFIERSVETLWRVNNSGKSFEETIQSVEKSKAQKEDL